MHPCLSLSSSIIHANINRLEWLSQFGFKRMEFGFFTEEELPALSQFIQNNRLRWGIHDPLPITSQFCYPQLTGPDSSHAQQSMARVEQSYRTASRLGAEYVLVHLPTTLFGSRPWLPIYGDTKVLNNQQTHKFAEQACNQLSIWSKQYQVKTYIENVTPNDFFYKASDYAAILAQYPEIGLCIDVGHLHLSAITYGMEFFQQLEELLPFIGMLHLWNMRPVEYRFWSHIPVHPTQQPCHGWIDIQKVLEVVYNTKPTCITIFEYAVQCPYSTNLEFLKQGFAWAEEVITRTID